MKQRLKFTAYYSISWIAYFFFIKLIFLLVNYHQSFPFIKLWPQIFIHGFLLDISVLGYVLLLPVLLIIVNSLLPGKWFKRVLFTYTTLLLIIFSILVVADLVIYPEWGFRLDITPFYYLENIQGVMASLKIMQIILFSLLSLALAFPFFWGFSIIMRNFSVFQTKRKIWAAPAFLLILGLLFLPIRGGLGTAPINTGSAYFHNNVFVNHASLNVFWNILYSVTNINDYTNPFKFYPGYNKNEVMRMNSNEDRASTPILTTSHPNILIIILESFTANVIKSLNDTYDVAVNLDSIAHKGILFNHFYASGDRSDKGLLAILSGYPAQPTTSIIKYPNKTEKLPGLANTLRNYGYKTTYYYGGDIDFANMRSYIVNSGFEHLISSTDFSPKERISSWGVPDEYLFNFVKSEIEKEKSTYFKVLFTLSSHKPYDVPGNKKWVEGNDSENQFLNSVGYTDYHLGKFIRELQSENLLKNTLVLIVADHGSAYPGSVAYNSKSIHHIPLVLYGPVLTETGKVIETVGSQVDIPATILGQIGINSSEYIFSKNLFSHNPADNSFYAFNRGFGYLSPDLELIYNLPNNTISAVKGVSNDTIEKQVKTYYENLYENFLSLN
jgi:phosphoglycerol transferase MdoB-like AlkP superfamily enzyme